MRIVILCTVLLFTTFVNAQKKKISMPSDPLIGTWCTTDQSMVLTFAKGDTLRVTSTTDSAMSGCGTYAHTDSTFAASLKNNDMVMKMSYRYRWKGRDTVEAKATSFTIDGEAVEYPAEWMSMARCTGKGGKK